MKKQETKDLCELKIDSVYSLLRYSSDDVRQHVIDYWDEHISKLKGVD